MPTVSDNCLRPHQTDLYMGTNREQFCLTVEVAVALCRYATGAQACCVFGTTTI